MSLLQQLQIGARNLRRAPGFALVAIVTLAVGIGLSTAVFTVAEALLLRPLPVQEQSRITVLTGRTSDGRVDNYPLGLQHARELAAGARTLDRSTFVSYYGASAVTVRNEGRISRVRRALVAGDFFQVLGAQPVLGRALRPEDDVAGAAPVLVLSHRAWQERYAGTPDVLGQRVTMHEDGRDYTIVGVMPPGLDFPRGTDAWATLLGVTPEAQQGFIALNVVGRLAPGATHDDAAQELTTFLQRESMPPPMRDLRGNARALPELVLGDTRPAVLVFAVASALLLLITCTNVANLLLVRGLARTREIAIRAALGAARGRIVAGLLVEHGLLALAGGIAGVGVAAAAIGVFVRIAPAGLPRLDEIALDATALLGAVAITAVAMLIFAVAPALLASRVSLGEVLRAGVRQSPSRRSRFASETLVAGQVALALLVLSAAALIARSFVNLERAELAFDAERLLVAEMALQADTYDTPPKQAAMLERLLPAVRGIPGVQSVSPVVAAPFSGAGGWDGRLARDGQTPEQASSNPMVNMEVVTPSYFETFGLRPLRGRLIEETDRAGAPRAVVISESMARQYWPDGDPVGQRLSIGPPPAAQTMTVVGVVPDTRYRDLRVARATIYFGLQQSFFPFTPTTLAIRVASDPAGVIPALRRTLEEQAPGVALASAQPFTVFLDAPLAQPRLNALLLVAFAGAAVVLAAVGLFGVMATMVRQRTRELGVRMALGATAREVGLLVLRRGLVIASVGLAVGLAGALAANRLLATLLFEVSPTDVTTLALVAVGLLVVAALASALPARSSTRIDPAVALRAD